MKTKINDGFICLQVTCNEEKIENEEDVDTNVFDSNCDDVASNKSDASNKSSDSGSDSDSDPDSESDSESDSSSSQHSEESGADDASENSNDSKSSGLNENYKKSPNATSDAEDGYEFNKIVYNKMQSKHILLRPSIVVLNKIIFISSHEILFFTQWLNSIAEC